MYTQCPQCEKQRNIKAEELRFSHGMISCEGCKNLFNAFELLQSGTSIDSLTDTTEIPDKQSSEDSLPDATELLHTVSNEETIPNSSELLPTPFNGDFVPDSSLLLRDTTSESAHDEENIQPPIPEEENAIDSTVDENKEDEEFLLFEKPAQKGTAIWTLAFGACLILLSFQIYFFEGYELTQNTKYRPWLEKTCKLLNCQMPPYKNLDELTILQGSLEPTEKEYFVFKAVFINQSDFKQDYPSVKLILQNFTGETIAERIFQPQDYLKNKLSQIQPEESAEISMKIVAPSKKMGGYSFEFI